MKTWSQDWKGSKKPKKQRKYVAKAPKHIKGKFLGTHLSKELRQKHKTRSMRVRKGDKILIMKGSFAGKTGTVEKINTDKGTVYIQGIELTKREGGKTQIPIKTSKLLITELVHGQEY
jgi:large subunit ribosomal protein L24